MTASPQQTVQAVAEHFGVLPTDVIKALLKRGVMATIHQELDSATVADLATGFRPSDEGGDELHGAGVPRPRPRPGLTGSAAVPLPAQGDCEDEPPDHVLVR